MTQLALSKDGIFKTIQGEGPRLGRPTVFMRLAGCNLACKWCDTSYTWDWTGKNGRVFRPEEEVVQRDLSSVRDELELQFCRSLTITGGEPLLQWKALQDLFIRQYRLNGGYWEEINFETNGTIWPEIYSEAYSVSKKWNFVVSPKLTNSGNPVLGDTDQDRRLRTLEKFAEWAQADFKFVCESVEDLNEVQWIQTALKAPLPNNRIWIMPQGTTEGLVQHRAAELADEVLKRGWNLTTRLHVSLWGNQRAK